MYKLSISKGGELFNILLENIISFVLEALNCTFHLLAQVEILSKSRFKISTVSEGSDPDTNKLVSSAKIKNVSFYFLCDVIHIY